MVACKQRMTFRRIGAACLLVSIALIAAICGCSKANSPREKLIIHAIEADDYATVERLLKRYPRLVDTEVTEGELGMFPESLLVLSARLDHTRITRLLISRGADVNASDWRHLTPLHYAAEHGNVHAMGLLLTGGADPNASGEYGPTPIMLATENGRGDAVALLKKAGARQGSSIHEAAALGDLNMVRAEVKRDPHAVNSQENNWSPLSLAARNGRLAVVEFLTRSGARVDPQAFREAARSGDLSVVKLLRTKVTDVDAREGQSSQYTALQVAAMEGHSKVVEYLLAEGADPSVKTQGFTSAELAREEDQLEIAELLSKRAHLDQD